MTTPGDECSCAGQPAHYPWCSKRGSRLCPRCGRPPEDPAYGLFGTYTIGTDPVEIPPTRCPDPCHDGFEERAEALHAIREALDSLETSGLYAQVTVAIEGEHGAQAIWGDDAAMPSVTYRIPARPSR